MDIRYPAKIEKQSDGMFYVSFRDLPDTFTEGESLEEALFNASEVLTGMLDWRLEKEKPIPEPTSARTGEYSVTPDAKTQAALLLRQARGDRSLSDLARAMETSWPSAQRLENPKHWPSLKSLDKAAAALGKKLVLTLEG
jgi:antitoxin HicB